jgi:hypothetical protein
VQHLFSNLMALAIAAHAVLGCCWHQACRCPEAAAASLADGGAAEAVLTSSCDCCDEHHGGRQTHSSCPANDAGHCPDCGECQGTCVYLLPKAASVGDDLACAWIVPSLHGLADGMLDTGSQIALLDRGPVDGPPLRLHLALQVLLI